MKLSNQSHNDLVSALQKALKNYVSTDGMSVVTDIHLQPNMESGELSISNDDEKTLGVLVLPEWVHANPEDFYIGAEIELKKALNRLRESGYFAKLNILKPYSFVLIDDERETVADLLLVDDDETLFLSDELLKGLDEELDAFLKELLEK